jgi:hypothetical protein
VPIADARKRRPALNPIESFIVQPLRARARPSFGSSVTSSCSHGTVVASRYAPLPLPHG